MVRISQLTDSRIKEAYAYSLSNKILSDSHEKGLLSLIRINTLTYPEIINESVNSEDLDVQDYAESEVRARDRIAQLDAQWRNLKRKH